MIRDMEQLDQARAALARLENAASALRARIEPANPALFAAMAESYWSSIGEIRRDIDAFLGLSSTAKDAVPLWMVLEGEAVSSRDISSRLLAEWLGYFRKAVYGVSSFFETGRIRSGGRPDARLLSSTDPHVLALAPGSIRVGLRLPGGMVQGNLFEASDDLQAIPQRALTSLLIVASWAASRDTEPPRAGGLDTDALTVVARFASHLAPSPRSTVRTVTFSGAAIPQEEPIRLEAESRDRLRGLVQLLSRVTEQTVIGQLREIDLDARRIILRERGEGVPDIKCWLPDELMAIAEELLDKQVEVRGLVSSATPDTMDVRAIVAVPSV